MDPLCLSKRIQDLRDRKNSQETSSGKGMESENSRLLLPGITSAGFY